MGVSRLSVFPEIFEVVAVEVLDVGRLVLNVGAQLRVLRVQRGPPVARTRSETAPA
jgi:hypothetical protein